MTMNRLLLCTDMDRTIIPNGRQPDHPDAAKRFRKLCRLPEVTLVYVTGRHLQLVRQAMNDYHLPEPDYAITDVGTKIYRQKKGLWTEMLAWQTQIATDWRGKTHGQLQDVLAGVAELTLQEKSKQNEYKLSYYLPLNADRDTLLKRVKQLLQVMDVDASLVWSIDEPEQVGLLDVLPRNATKLHGIEFLQQQLGYDLQEIIFAGDSGNDLPVLISSIRSILVANADAETRQQALKLAKENGYEASLYLARQENSPFGGNYAAGVVQGVEFFAPEIGALL